MVGHEASVYMGQIISGLGNLDMSGFYTNYSGESGASTLMNYFCRAWTILCILYSDSLEFVAVGHTEETYYGRV